MLKSNTQLDHVNCCLELLLSIKFAICRNENKQAPQKENPVEDTVTVSLREYQMTKEVVEDMQIKNKLKLKEKG